jgi:putative heme-binding domain-containing protein
MSRQFRSQSLLSGTVKLALSVILLLLPKSGYSAAIEPQATDVETLKVLDGFDVELLYSVPKDTQGSWVAMTVDAKGRLVVSDQYGGLYRVTPPAIGSDPNGTFIEPLGIELGQAQGLLYAFDSLYVMVANGGAYTGRGLYRVFDRDGDDQYDEVKYLRKLEGGGEHGPHAIVPAPDGESLYVIIGNQTKITETVGSKVPKVWDEDIILPRAYGNGFMKGVPAPGGCIYQIDPDGKNWEIMAVGFRNEYDAAVNRHGELFTFDADMEWDMNTPWYRPTRVCHVVSGGEFGWRNGSGKWPAYYPDSVPATIDIGPGSPTGITFGYGAKFPAKYQEALFINDWSYGKLYAVHLNPDGASYSASFEEFISGSPLPLTDIVVNPNDGALYFAIGGRRTKSGLYRVTYKGSESIASPKPNQQGANARSIRRKLESFHGKKDPNAVAAAWPYLGHSDRFLRYAARVALEHQDPKTWQSRVFTEGNHEALINGAIALARVGDDSNRAQLLRTLNQIPLDALDNNQVLRLTRAYGLIGMRLGRPTASESDTLIKRLDVLFPSEDRYLNSELCKLLVYLQSPNAASKGVSLLDGAPSQEEQIDYAMSLRHLKEGWNPDLRKRYFTWFNRASSYRGGASFKKFVDYIKNEALEQLPAEEKADIESLLANATPPVSPLAAIGSRAFVKEWTLEELTPIVANGLQNRDFAKGRKLFGEVACFACHRFSNEGGALGPDLTGVAGRFSSRDLLESILDPNKEVSDQYAPIVVTTTEGEQVTGRIMNLAGDNIMISVNMFDPNEIESVDRTKVESIEPSKVSMMPEGLLHLLNKDEVLDLMAYLLSRGDSGHAMFKK